jgi:hypothetical protein
MRRGIGYVLIAVGVALLDLHQMTSTVSLCQ